MELDKHRPGYESRFCLNEDFLRKCKVDNVCK